MRRSYMALLLGSVLALTGCPRDQVPAPETTKPAQPAAEEPAVEELAPEPVETTPEATETKTVTLAIEGMT